jgi:hypothetical protein
MANTSSVQILEDGIRNTVLKFTGILDTSNLASTVVVNIADWYRDPLGPTIGQYRVDRIEYDIEDPIAVLLWWGGVPTRFASMAGRGMFDPGRKYGGFQNTEAVQVRDGRILATTVGYVSGTISFELTMWLVKQAFKATVSGYILMEDGVSYILQEDNVSKIYLE